jgi:putative Mg2+ transporter-C (MgtC) family protein
MGGGWGEVPELSTGDLILRVLLAAALGGAIGFEREISDQPAGFRTHILVSLGAALFTMLGAYGLAEFEGVAEVRFDPTRVAAQVVTGIGFLGAGAIIQQGVSVKGLTTAASLWATAAIGTAVALGFEIGALVVAGAVLISLFLLRYVRKAVIDRLKPGFSRLVVDVSPGVRLGNLSEVIEGHGGHIESIKVHRDAETGERLVMQVKLPIAVHLADVVVELGRVDGVQNVDTDD